MFEFDDKSALNSLFSLFAYLYLRKTSVCESRSWEIVTTVCLVCLSRCLTTPETAWRWAWICVRPSSKIPDLPFFLSDPLSLSLSLSHTHTCTHKHTHTKNKHKHPVKQIEQKECQTWFQLCLKSIANTTWIQYDKPPIWTNKKFKLSKKYSLSASPLCSLTHFTHAWMHTL